jgi:acyl-CoA dehydrogenase
MIDFQLSDRDEEILSMLRAEGMIARKYARYYDDREEDELPPDVLPEGADLPGKRRRLIGERKIDEDGGNAVLQMWLTIYQTWGDYAVRVKRSPGGLGNAALLAAGSKEQNEKWGHLTLAMAITEPGCGSDPSALRTKAVLDGDEWVINGEKIFVTAGIRGEGVVVWATVDPTAGRAGIKSFLIEKGTPGFNVVKKEKKLGIRGDDTAAFHFEDCRIPRENLLGGDESVAKKGSGGFKGAMKTFNMTRPAVAALGLGISQAALDFTREELTKSGIELNYGGGASVESAIVSKFIDLEAMQEAAILTVMRAAWLADEGQSNNVEASIAKAKGGEAVRLITQGCIELLGPMGISRDHLIEKWFRDCRITDIYEGTGQIQHLIIARNLLGYTRKELS